MGLETLSTLGAQTLPFFSIKRRNINKAIHRRVAGRSDGILHKPEQRDLCVGCACYL